MKPHFFTSFPSAVFSQISILFSLNKFFTNRERFLNKLLLLFFSSIFLCLSAYADYTVANGATINAASLVGQSGILTINGKVTLSSDVTLSGFTSVIINAPNGEIYWSNNSNLTFSVGSTISINTSAPGLQASGSNGAQRLYIGNAIIQFRVTKQIMPILVLQNLISLEACRNIILILIQMYVTEVQLYPR